MNIKSYLLILSTFIVLCSCVNKEWPKNSIDIIKEEFKKNQNYEDLASLFGEDKMDYYFAHLVNTYKSAYPNYNDFIKDSENNPEKLIELSLPCAKQMIDNNYNNLWNIISKNTGVENLKNILLKICKTIYGW